MNDAIMIAHQGSSIGDILGREDATVLWVTITGDFEGTIEEDNAGRKDNPVYGYYNLSNPHTYDLGGPTRFDDDEGNPDRFAMGAEFIGTVHPSNFNQNLRFDRDANGILYGGPNGMNALASQSFSESIPDGNDYCDFSFPRDEDPQSGDSVGTIYDWDNPGVPAIDATLGTIERKRSNFKAFVSFNGELCSNIYKWHIAMSMIKRWEGAAGWDEEVGITGDNVCGPQWLDHLSWNLE